MRIAISPVLGYLIVNESYLLALALFTAAGITDVVCAHTVSMATKVYTMVVGG